ncbi:unnamed protein product [Polarella glacialis]|uniref:DUF4395 domain-containing protein n=1 Tax=Polarella glacialis TaxID=89957 RepID=A0A813JN81_POLGL|nr:unnamed protein product [Polarella glacialis]
MVILSVVSYVQMTPHSTEIGTVRWTKLKSALQTLYTIICYDTLAGATLGLATTPTGIIGAVLSTYVLKQSPEWKNSRPKRFAWTFGLVLLVFCMLLGCIIPGVQFELGVISAAGVCMVQTWLEISLGF